MRIISATVAVLATAVVLSSAVSPAMATGKHFNIFKVIAKLVKADYTPATAGTAPTPGTNTIVYFGTCNNLAGFQQAGNADENGFCLPFESLTGDIGDPGTPGSSESCTVTIKLFKYSENYAPASDCKKFNDAVAAGAAGGGVPH